MSLLLDAETLEALHGGPTQYEAFAWSGWAERQQSYVREAGARYRQTPQGKRTHATAQQRYLASDKGRAAQSRYRATPKAKAARAAADKRYRERKRFVAQLAALLLLGGGQ